MRSPWCLDMSGGDHEPSDSLELGYTCTNVCMETQCRVLLKLSVDFSPIISSARYSATSSFHEDKFSGSLRSPNVNPVDKLALFLGLPIIQFWIAYMYIQYYTNGGGRSGSIYHMRDINV